MDFAPASDSWALFAAISSARFFSAVTSHPLGRTQSFPIEVDDPFSKVVVVFFTESFGNLSRFSAGDALEIIWVSNAHFSFDGSVDGEFTSSSQAGVLVAEAVSSWDRLAAFNFARGIFIFPSL